jgi:hypothetical protein
VGHYLDQTLQAKSLLLGLKEVEGSHLGENLAASCLPVIADFDLNGKIGYFMSDNVGSNDLAVEAFCKKLKLKNSIARRLRCLGHIINLAAKAFLFNKEEEGFDFEISELKAIKFAERQALELLMFWRKKGPIGKLHNLINWIRNSP